MTTNTTTNDLPMNNSPNDLLVSNVECNECGNVLPPHTQEQHLDKNDPIHNCPHTDSDSECYVYKMSWYKTKRHTIPNCIMYYAEEKHTRWGHNWTEGVNGSDVCKIYVVIVNRDSHEYSSAVSNSHNQNAPSESDTTCDCCMKSWRDDLDGELTCHCNCSSCHCLLRECRYNCKEHENE